LQAGGGAVERLLPCGFAEMRPRVGRVDLFVRHFRHVLADHRLGQALRIADVVEAKAAFHTQALLVGGAITAADIEQLVVFDVIGELAADAAIGAHRVHLAVGEFGAHVLVVYQRRRHQCAGRTGLHAFAAGDAGRAAHWIVEIKHNFFAMAASRHADDVVDLHFAAGADAEIALDAGVEIDRHGDVASVGRGHFFALGKTGDVDAHFVGPAPELGLRVMRGRTFRLVGDQKLEHHFARGFGALRDGFDFHAFGRLADTARSQHTLAFDLDHAGAAIAVGAVARLRRITKVRNFGALG